MPVLKKRHGGRCDEIRMVPMIRKMLKEPDAQIRVTRRELLKLLLVADLALDGDSNDAEHDALYDVREGIAEFIEESERRF